MGLNVKNARLTLDIMVKVLRILLSFSIMMLLAACSGSASGEVSDDIVEFAGAGTCVPALKHDEFVILAWYELIDINADNLLDQYKDPSAEWRLRMLSEAGFNTYYDYRLDCLEEAEALLGLGDKVGMNIILDSPELHDPSQTEKVIETMAVHPSLFAYSVWDEPEVSEFPEVIGRIKEIYKYDKEHPCYVNLLPNYAWDEWVEDRYLETVRHYLKSVPVSFLSFDYYPVVFLDEDGEMPQPPGPGQRMLREAWYHNLEDIRTAALEAEVPIWAFALAKTHGVYPMPTLADLRLQQFSNLVYGAVAFQYFTARAIVWKESLTSIYPLVKQVNHELKQMEKIFLGAEIKGIWHTGDQIPRGTKKPDILPDGISSLETRGEGAVVSHFTNNGKNYIAFVNRSCVSEITLSIRFDGEASCVHKDGSQSSVSASYVIEPGDIRIFTWK